MNLTLPSDAECLEAFVRRRAESAFRHIVDRYGGIVYSAARRQAHDEATTQDIVQAVFIVFVRRAPKVNPATLAGWLVKTTYLVARESRRCEGRRIRRESIAASLGSQMRESRSDWQEISPLLDEAICNLSNQDRSAVCLRFLQQKTMSEVAVAMGITEQAASKRVSRAIARMRSYFLARGVTVAGAAIVASLATQSVEACPAALLDTVAASILPTAPVAGAGPAVSLAKGIIFMATAKKVGINTVIILLLLSVTASVFVAKSLFWDSDQYSTSPLNSAAPPVAASVAPQPGNRIKVGIYLSDYTATGPHWIPDQYGWKDQLAAVRALHDPSVELIPVIEHGSAANPDLARVLSLNFPGKQPIDASNPQELGNLQVLVSQAAHNVPSDVQNAIRQAVQNGVGFLNHGFMTVTPGFTPLYGDLSGMDNVHYGYNLGPVKCEIVGDNPLLGDLAGRTGMTMMIEPAGQLGQLRGIPLIRVTDMRKITVQPRRPLRADMYMHPFYLTQFGRGRIMVFAFAHYQVPTVLNTANHGRFYIHCVQWLAGEPLS